MKQEHSKEKTKVKDAKIKEKAFDKKFEAPVTGLALLLTQKTDDMPVVRIRRNAAQGGWLVKFLSGEKKGKTETHAHVILRDAKFEKEKTQKYVGCVSYETEYKGFVCGACAFMGEAEPPVAKPDDSTKLKFNPDDGSFNVKEAQAVFLSGSSGHAIQRKQN